MGELVGFTKSWRKEIISDIWQMPPLYHRVWHFLLQSVSWEKNTFPTTNLFGIHLNPGQGLFSIQGIVDGVAWRERNIKKAPNKKTVLGILKWLEFNSMIVRESNGQGTFISICNWEIYQSKEKVKVTQGIPQGIPQGTPQGIPHTTHSKEVKEVKEYKEVLTTGEKSPEPPSPKKKVFDPQTIRPDWIPEKDWTDIITHRKKHPKKPVQTERAYRGIIDQLQQAIDAGYSLDECLDKWLNNSSWMTFKLEYIQNTFCPMPNRKTQKATQNQQYAIELLKEM